MEVLAIHWIVIQHVGLNRINIHKWYRACDVELFCFAPKVSLIYDSKSSFFMDFMLEEELIDLMTFCLQNPDSVEVKEKKARISEIGKELFDDGGVDALENFFFVLKNRITEEIGKDPEIFKPLWNGLTDEWKF